MDVTYFLNPKSWMNSEIMIDLLEGLNSRMRRQHRQIFLFLDNAGCHPVSLQEMFSNIRVVFLPSNTTSRIQPLDLQPLDAGVIKNFKERYRKPLLKFVVSRVNRGLTALDIAKEVDVLQAVRWIKPGLGRSSRRYCLEVLRQIQIFPCCTK